MKFIAHRTLLATKCKGVGARKIAVVTLLNVPGFHPWGTRISEHRFNPVFVKQMTEALDEISCNRDVVGLVVVNESKYFSNGMDTEYIRAHARSAKSLQISVEKLMSRILTFPMVTMAVINGHAVGAGAIWSLCFDHRLIRSGSHFFAPAVELGIVYSAGFLEVVKTKVADPGIRRNMLLHSNRLTVDELEQYGIVDQVIDQSDCSVVHTSSITEEAIPMYMNYIMNKTVVNREALSEVKRRLYKDALAALGNSRDPDFNMWWDKLPSTSSKL